MGGMKAIDWSAVKTVVVGELRRLPFTTCARPITRVMYVDVAWTHRYWGLWAVNQAATEGMDGFPFLTYARQRIGQYWVLVGAANAALG
jgi:hypothetical protein